MVAGFGVKITRVGKGQNLGSAFHMHEHYIHIAQETIHQKRIKPSLKVKAMHAGF